MELILTKHVWKMLTWLGYTYKTLNFFGQGCKEQIFYLHN